MKLAIQFFKTSSKRVLEGLRFYYFTIKKYRTINKIHFNSLWRFNYFSQINTILSVLDASHSTYAVDDQSDATNKTKRRQKQKGFHSLNIRKHNINLTLAFPKWLCIAPTQISSFANLFLKCVRTHTV